MKVQQTAELAVGQLSCGLRRPHSSFVFSFLWILGLEAWTSSRPRFFFASLSTKCLGADAERPRISYLRFSQNIERAVIQAQPWDRARGRPPWAPDMPYAVCTNWTWPAHNTTQQHRRQAGGRPGSVMPCTENYAYAAWVCPLRRFASSLDLGLKPRVVTSRFPCRFEQSISTTHGSAI